MTQSKGGSAKDLEIHPVKFFLQAFGYTRWVVQEEVVKGRGKLGRKT